MVIIKILKTGSYSIPIKGKESSISKIRIKIRRKLGNQGFFFP